MELSFVQIMVWGVLALLLFVCSLTCWWETEGLNGNR